MVAPLATRRALLGAALALPVVGSAAVPALASRAHHGTDPMLAALFAEHAAATKRVEAIEDRLRPIAEAAHVEVAALPHTEASYQAVSGKTVTLSTDSRANVGSAYNFVRMSRSQGANHIQQRALDYVQASRRIVAADLWRRRQENKIMAPARALVEESDKACEASGDILVQVEAFQAKTLSDLIVKLEWLAEHGGIEPNVAEDHLLPNLKRLAVGGLN